MKIFVEFEFTPDGYPVLSHITGEGLKKDETMGEAVAHIPLMMGAVMSQIACSYVMNNNAGLLPLGFSEDYMRNIIPSILSSFQGGLYKGLRDAEAASSAEDIMTEMDEMTFTKSALEDEDDE